MGRALGGFLVGFFLALGLFSVFVYLQLAPLENDIKNTLPYANSAYETTHSDTYLQVTALIPQIKQLADAASAIPGLGGYAIQVSTGLSSLNVVLTTAQGVTEKILPLLQNLLLLIQLSIPGIVISIFGVMLGAYMLKGAAPVAGLSPTPQPAQSKSSKTCLKCGTHASKNDEFCGECGEKFHKK